MMIVMFKDNNHAVLGLIIILVTKCVEIIRKVPVMLIIMED